MPPGDAEQLLLGRQAAHDGRGAVLVDLKPPPRLRLETAHAWRSSYPHFPRPSHRVQVALSVRLSRPHLACEEDAARALSGQRRASQRAIKRHDAARAALEQEDKGSALSAKKLPNAEAATDVEAREGRNEASDADSSSVRSRGSSAGRFPAHSPYALPRKPFPTMAETPQVASLVPLVAAAFHDHWRAEWREDCARLAAEAASHPKVGRGGGFTAAGLPAALPPPVLPDYSQPAPPCWKQVDPPPSALESRPRSNASQQPAGSSGLSAVEFAAWHDSRLHRGMVAVASSGAAMVDIDRPLCLLPPSQQREMLEAACAVLDALRRHGGQVCCNEVTVFPDLGSPYDSFIPCTPAGGGEALA
jgi:hypothetical protein